MLQSDCATHLAAGKETTDDLGHDGGSCALLLRQPQQRVLVVVLHEGPEQRTGLKKRAPSSACDRPHSGYWRREAHETQDSSRDQCVIRAMGAQLPGANLEEDKRLANLCVGEPRASDDLLAA